MTVTPNAVVVVIFHADQHRPEIHCELDTDQFPTGLKYTAKQVDALPLHRHQFHPDWNYTIHPRHADTDPP